MLRGNRIILVAAVGCLILCGAKPPSEQAQRPNRTQQTHPTPQAAPPPLPTAAASPSRAFTPYRGYNPDPCYQAKDHDAADLCAQWRAAIAAEKAAHEARRATFWSIVATILSLIGVSGLIYTILQTHGALNEARRSNLIAQRANARSTRQAAASATLSKEANDLAGKLGEAQVRCYLSGSTAQVGFDRPPASGPS